MDSLPVEGCHIRCITLAILIDAFSEQAEKQGALKKNSCFVFGARKEKFVIDEFCFTLVFFYLNFYHYVIHLLERTP